MSKIAIAALALAACGLAGAANATPLTVGSRISVASPTENVRVVCRERTVWRTNKWGERKRVTVRDCDRMGRGPGYYGYDRPRYGEPRRGGRYYHNGYYYSDPGFTIRIR
jgi:hypothetical protein